MSWCASHIYFQHRPGVIEALRNHTLLSRGLYHVDDLSNFPWHDPLIEHGLPEGGLIVVRELAGKSTIDPELFVTDALDWDGFDGSGAALPTLLPTIAFSGIEEEENYDVEPPPELLGTLKSVSQTTGAKGAYYYHVTWAGQTECEVAWIFSGEERAAIYSDDQTIAIRREDGSLDRMEGQVLNLVLAEFGLDLKTPFFALHDRAFPWAKYRQ